MEKANIITVKTQDCTFCLDRKSLPFNSEKTARTYLTKRIGKYTKREISANVELIIESVVSELYPKRLERKTNVETPPPIEQFDLTPENN